MQGSRFGASVCSDSACGHFFDTVRADGKKVLDS